MAIRVLHIIGSLRCGGAQKCLQHIVDNNDSGEVEYFVYPLRCKSIEMPIQGEVLIIPRSNYDLRKFFDILRICRDYKIDIIHAHLHKAIMGALLARFFLPVKVVVHEHGPIFRRGIQYSFYRLFLRLFGHKADACIAVSEATARQLRKKTRINPDRITVIPNAVDLTVFNPEKYDRKECRRQLGIAEQDIVVGFVGRLNYVKGVDILVEAMSYLLAKSPDYLLLLVGDGPERKKLKNLAAQHGITERIRFLGFRDDVPEIMSAFDVAVICSREEACPLVIFEIFSMCKPVICSKIDGLTQFVKDKKNGLVMEDYSSLSLADLIAGIQKDKGLVGQIVKDASQYCNDFTVLKYNFKLKELYCRFIWDDLVKQ